VLRNPIAIRDFLQISPLISESGVDLASNELLMNSRSNSLCDDARRILDNLNSVVLLFDPDLRLRYMNAAAEMLFQVSARHMEGLAAGSLIHCPSEMVEKNLNRALEFGHPFTEREINMSLPGDRSVTIDCTVIPLNESDGGKGLLVEIQRLDRQLRISREEHRLIQHQATRELIRGLAHEIKNPLGGLRGAAQLLERELVDPALHEYTQIIISEVDRLQSLVDNLLGPNRLPRLEQVNIHSLLERVRHLVLAESGKEMQVVRDYDPSIPELYVDSDRIIQALLNIVRNAVSALKGEPNPQVILRTRVLRQMTIGTQRHRLVAQVEIEDNGPGVAEEILETLFYPMVTASEGGMGLGLSISQSLINLHRGLIECDSKPGHTIFRVLLPVEKPNA
jgi:two-component system nitrogen regulation sensor histidine kinase GlnL